MEVLLCFLLGLTLSFLISKPIAVYKAREYCKIRGLEKDLPRLKWYERWI